MDTNAGRRKVRKVLNLDIKIIYNPDVSMYNEPPSYTISPAEFEELALERLQLMRTIEQASLKGHKLFTDEWKKSIKEDLSKAGLKKYVRLMNGFGSHAEVDVQARRADHLSHFILRLAYCRSEDLRKWFTARELEWFRIKFQAQSQQGILEFLELNNFTYKPISEDEKSNLKNDIIMCISGFREVLYDTNDFYKVHFTEVIPLVKQRKVFLHRGYAYIPMGDLIVCIQSKFRANLSEALNVYNHRLPSLDDDRLNSLLCSLHNLYTGKAYAADIDKQSIDPANLDLFAKQHYPLCMKHIHGVLRSQHHLKHKCRLIYGLFLKGIGLSYDDAMEFWHNEFTKKIDSSQFEKQYAYNFRHQYGKTGNRTDYSPYSCIKIIMDNVGHGDHSGCPFKHWDAAILKQKLVEFGIGSEGVNSVMELVSNGHYQIACTKYFEYIHGQQPLNVINHPNQYFQESVNLTKETQQKKNQ